MADIDIKDLKLPVTTKCFGCRRQKLAGFRPEVLTNSNYEANEPIEPEE